MNTQRIETFSDGVFAIAITLLVLDIRPPQASPHLVADLLALWPSYLAYLISFLLIGLIWANHHEMFHHIHRGDRMLMFFNTLLLMCVAFLPFVTAVLSSSLREHAGLRTAVVLYGSTLVVGGIFVPPSAAGRHHHSARCKGRRPPLHARADGLLDWDRNRRGCSRSRTGFVRSTDPFLLAPHHARAAFLTSNA